MQIQLKTSQFQKNPETGEIVINEGSEDQITQQQSLTSKLNVEDLEHGPYDQSKRQCKDIFCFFFYWLNTAAMVILSAWAYFAGTPSNIYRATDSAGNVCGQKRSAVQFYKYAYFYNPTTYDLSKRVCVSECPNWNDFPTMSNLPCYPAGPSCIVNITINQNGVANTPLQDLGNYFIGYQSSPKIDRICLPSQKTLQNAFLPYDEQIANGLIQSKLLDFISDVQINYGWLFVMAAVAIVSSIVNWIGMKFFPAFTIWVSLILTVLLFLFIGLVFLYNGRALGITDHVGRLGIPTTKDRTFYAIYGGFCLTFSIITVIVFVYCFQQIGPTLQMIKIASKFFKQLPTGMLVVLMMTGMMFVFWITAISSMVYALSASQYTVTGQVFTQVSGNSDRGIIIFYYFIFNIFWTHQIFVTTMVFGIASVTAMYYFTNGPVEQMNKPMWRTLMMIMRYHFGSLVFGSLVLLIVQFVQFIIQLLFFVHCWKYHDANGCFKAVDDCLQCLSRNMSKITQRLNRFAYIQIAIRGKNYMEASKDGYRILKVNVHRYGFLFTVDSILLFMMRLGIALIPTTIFYCLCTYWTFAQTQILEPIYFVLIIFYFSLGMATVIMGSYQACIDTFMTCYVIDELNQNGKAPLYPPPQMAELFMFIR